ncbi:hypothetical protein [Synoicihabitans lomoniglobus]|uniref:DUF11 domain-containing protein n=1 Tax=Synoicihabitans lomoniglobus TaxID=2909285 RepID=A0AAF0CPD1_9BACT|nr:hypothetical protein [Opitutaceae bacterium LMO-M01]WED64114.1 hypothetical protein PXH66_17390 [Opitutaceae bacterium LMO-M01]
MKSLVWFSALTILWFSSAGRLSAAACPKSACVGISSNIVTVDGPTATILNTATGALFGTTGDLTPTELQSISDAEVNVGNLLLNLTGSDDTQAALATSVTPAGLLDAIAGTLLAQGDTEAAAAVAAIPVDDAAGTITLGSFIDAEDPSMLSIGGLDLITASSQQYSYDNTVVPVPQVIDGAALGVGDVLNNVTITTIVEEPPIITCGPEGTTFRSAGLRLKISVDLVNQDLTPTLLDALGPAIGTLPPGTSVDQATLSKIDLYVVVGRGDGVIEVIDADNSFVKVRARPGLADVYLGAIDDAFFFDRNTTIDSSDFGYTEIGELDLSLSGEPVTASINARATASGQDAGYYILQYFGPFSETQTAGVGSVAIDNIVDELTNSLEINVETKEPAVLDPVSQAAFDQLVPTLTSDLNSTYGDALSPTLRTTLTDVVDPVLDGLGVNLGEIDVTVYGVDQMCGYALGGTVYRDDNRNGFIDNGEAGTGLTLYAKLIPADSPGGPATQAVTVDPATGVYTFPNVMMGEYHIVIDDNSTLSDVTPAAVPSGWTAIEQNTLRREQVVMLDANVTNQNFGLASGVTVSGIVFVDTGTGGGTANDGRRNGAEPGQTGVTLRLENVATGAVLGTTQTGGDGTYSFFVDGGIPAGTDLRVRAVDATGHVSTGGDVGDSAGTYDAATDAITFSHDPALDRVGLDFGDVPLSRLTTEGRQTVEAGAVAFYPHTFEAGTTGRVEFTVTTRATPAIDGWSTVLYQDLNNNGQVDPGEPQVTGPLDVAAGESVGLVAKVFVPVAAPVGAQFQSVLAAELTAANAPALTFSPASRTDLTEVGDTGANGLTLFKEVDKDLALPGETLTYTIRYQNQSSAPISDLVVRDMTPTFTKLVAAPTPALAEGLTAVSLTNPGAGGTGALTWTFEGELRPGATGEVTFSVRLDD